jgi:hypothetical protein
MLSRLLSATILSPICFRFLSLITLSFYMYISTYHNQLYYLPLDYISTLITLDSL